MTEAEVRMRCLELAYKTLEDTHKGNKMMLTVKQYCLVYKRANELFNYVWNKGTIPKIS